jgi:hypothetical protein
MTIIKFVLILFATILFCLPQFSLADSHEHHAKPESDHGHHAKSEAAHGVELSPDLNALLNQEMALIQKGMMDLIPAVAAGEWGDVAAIGKQIKASFILKQKLTASQKEELHRVLPELFIEMDQDFHKSAGMLAHAAEMKNADVVNFYFYKMNTACVSCHGKFAAARFPGLFQGNDQGGHHD